MVKVLNDREQVNVRVDHRHNRHHVHWVVCLLWWIHHGRLNAWRQTQHHCFLAIELSGNDWHRTDVFLPVCVGTFIAILAVTLHIELR